MAHNCGHGYYLKDKKEYTLDNGTLAYHYGNLFGTSIVEHSMEFSWKTQNRNSPNWFKTHLFIE